MSAASSSDSPAFLSRAARDLRVALALGACHFALSAVFVRQDTFLNNEGIFTFIAARMLPDDPVPVLFLLKLRPPIAALYAGPAALGFDAFGIAHALVAAAAVPLTAVLARALGHERPNLPALVVAASALLLACGAAGVGNADATTLGVLAATCSFAWKRPALAGFLAALLPFARAEMALLTAALALHATIAGGPARLRFWAGLTLPAIVFVGAGAVYHEDPLWLLHHPPHVTHSVPYSEIMGRQMFGGEPHKITLTLLTITPTVGLLIFLRPSVVSWPERTLGGFVLTFVGVLSVLPGTSPLNFGDMPRYVLPSLPFVALLVGSATERLARGLERPAQTAGAIVLAALLVLAHVQDALHGAPALLYGVAAWAAVALLSAVWKRAVPMAVVGIALAGAPLLADATRLRLRRPTPVLGEYLLAEAGPDTTVLTNVPELPLWLARHGGEHVRIHHMIAADQRYELDTLANDAVGQREAAYALLERHWYGPIVWPEEVPDRLRAGTWLALRDDRRTEHILDERQLASRSETIHLGDGIRVVKVLAP